MPDPARYTVSLTTVEPLTIAAVRARVPMGGVPAVFGRYLDQVYAASREGLVHLDGQNVFLYDWSPDRPNELDVAFGVGITAPFNAVGNVESVVVPAGEVVTTTHWGSYARLRDAHAAITEWCNAHGRRKSGRSWEVYGHWTADESRLRTDVYYLLEPAA